ncbi:uncharacterized protein LOC120840731 isoform X1 [Ixodes scapularis]|uniref:uncharacterized protein LOC120840731 isoform X1 n=1 Tax=Ixodes scapularis TaxID=6945 RepID=UPI001A9E29C9|nr:uncharacterized protein LOC120840731 isoform X1 [Ixodes scapularis]
MSRKSCHCHICLLDQKLLLILAGRDPASGPCSTSQVRRQDLASAFFYHQDVPGPRGFVTSPSFPIPAPSPTKASLPQDLASGHGSTTRSMTAKLFFLITQEQDILATPCIVYSGNDAEGAGFLHLAVDRQQFLTVKNAEEGIGAIMAAY